MRCPVSLFLVYVSINLGNCIGVGNTEMDSGKMQELATLKNFPCTASPTEESSKEMAQLS